MTYSLEMNRQLGTKWFTFYTKVRPWFAGISALVILKDFVEYVDIYMSNIWLLLYFLATIAQVVLCVMVAIKADENYGEFVRFVKGVLIFETIDLAYSQSINRYIQSGGESGEAVTTFIVILGIGYLVWYRLNVKYFEKRMMKITADTTAPEFTQIPQSPQEPETAKANFCRICGEKLKKDSKFCYKCGTKIEAEAE